MKELATDPDKRFIQVETGFFWRWWEQKNEFMRNVTRQLVDAGQLVFTGGGEKIQNNQIDQLTREELDFVSVLVSLIMQSQSCQV